MSDGVLRRRASIFERCKMKPAKSLIVAAHSMALLRWRRKRSCHPQIAHLVEHKILKSPAAIAQKSRRPGIDKISEQNAVSRFNLRPNQADRMPGIIANRKRVAGIRREDHLRPFRLTRIRQHLVKNGTNMRRRIVCRQIKLDCDALPERVRVRRNVVSRNVARQDWYWIHSHLRKIRSKTAFQARREPLYENFFQLFGTKDAARDVPDCTLLVRQV